MSQRMSSRVQQAPHQTAETAEDELPDEGYSYFLPQGIADEVVGGGQGLTTSSTAPVTSSSLAASATVPASISSTVSSSIMSNAASAASASHLFASSPSATISKPFSSINSTQSSALSNVHTTIATHTVSGADPVRIARAQTTQPATVFVQPYSGTLPNQIIRTGFPSFPPIQAREPGSPLPNVSFPSFSSVFSSNLGSTDSQLSNFPHSSPSPSLDDIGLDPNASGDDFAHNFDSDALGIHFPSGPLLSQLGAAASQPLAQPLSGHDLISGQEGNFRQSISKQTVRSVSAGAASVASVPLAPMEFDPTQVNNLLRPAHQQTFSASQGLAAKDRNGVRPFKKTRKDLKYIAKPPQLSEAQSSSLPSSPSRTQPRYKVLMDKPRSPEDRSKARLRGDLAAGGSPLKKASRRFAQEEPNSMQYVHSHPLPKQHASDDMLTQPPSHLGAEENGEDDLDYPQDVDASPFVVTSSKAPVRAASQSQVANETQKGGAKQEHDSAGEAVASSSTHSKDKQQPISKEIPVKPPSPAGSVDSSSSADSGKPNENKKSHQNEPRAANQAEASKQGKQSEKPGDSKNKANKPSTPNKPAVSSNQSADGDKLKQEKSKEVQSNNTAETALTSNESNKKGKQGNKDGDLTSQNAVPQAPQKKDTTPNKAQPAVVIGAVGEKGGKKPRKTSDSDAPGATNKVTQVPQSALSDSSSQDSDKNAGEQAPSAPVNPSQSGGGRKNRNRKLDVPDETEKAVVKAQISPSSSSEASSSSSSHARKTLPLTPPPFVGRQLQQQMQQQQQQQKAKAQHLASRANNAASKLKAKAMKGANRDKKASPSTSVSKGSLSSSSGQEVSQASSQVELASANSAVEHEGSSTAPEQVPGISNGGGLVDSQLPSVLRSLRPLQGLETLRKLLQRGLRFLMGVGGLMLSFLWTCFVFILRLHLKAGSVLTLDHHLAFCFSFLYIFPSLVHYTTLWAPPWAAPCLFYAFLMQVFCTQGPPVLVTIFRVVLPLLFLTEGVSHHSFLLELNGAERLVLAFVLSSFKTGEFYRPTFLLSLSVEIMTALLCGSLVPVQWAVLVLSLLAIHSEDKDRCRSIKVPVTNPSFVSASSSPFSFFPSMKAAFTSDSSEPKLPEDMLEDSDDDDDRLADSLGQPYSPTDPDYENKLDQIDASLEAQEYWEREFQARQQGDALRRRTGRGTKDESVNSP